MAESDPKQERVNGTRPSVPAFGASPVGKTTRRQALPDKFPCVYPAALSSIIHFICLNPDRSLSARAMPIRLTHQTQRLGTFFLLSHMDSPAFFTYHFTYILMS